MDALLRFCQSEPGMFALGLLFLGTAILVQLLVFTDGWDRLVRFVKDAWHSDTRA